MHYTQVIEPLNSQRHFHKLAAYKLASLLASLLRAPPLVNKTKKASYKCYQNHRTAGISWPGLGKAIA